MNAPITPLSVVDDMHSTSWSRSEEQGALVEKVSAKKKKKKKKKKKSKEDARKE